MNTYSCYGIAALALSLASSVLGGPPSTEKTSTQTAQSVMISITPDASAYQIEGETIWKFDRELAESYYTNELDTEVDPIIGQGSGATQTSPGAPPPDANALMQHAQQERCIFFCGGDLSEADSYTLKVNGTKGWSWTYTYKITPKQPSVAQYECWSTESTGATSVSLGFTGFFAGESYMESKSTKKYSFTMIETAADGTLISRVQNAQIDLQKLGQDGQWAIVSPTIDVGSPSVGSASEDFVYYGNAGAFGSATARASLHADGSKSAANVSSILVNAPDSFKGNDNDLAAGNVHKADFDALFDGISEAGTYRFLVTALVKGNSGTGTYEFSVTSSRIEIGGCFCE